MQIPSLANQYKSALNPAQECFQGIRVEDIFSELLSHLPHAYTYHERLDKTTNLLSSYCCSLLWDAHGRGVVIGISKGFVSVLETSFDHDC